MTTDLFVVSDLHLSPAGPLNNFHAGQALVRFSDALPDDATLVLAGDLFDFLQLDVRPPHLDLPGAPDLVAETLERLRREEWADAFFRSLGRFLDRGGRVVVLPGNHDLELFHPAAADVLRHACGLAVGDPRLVLHARAEPWTTRVGKRQVIIGHGHRGDWWNDFDPALFHRALGAGTSALPLPPGSQLVLSTLQAFKRARDPETGERRFAFVDLLKPETPWVPLFLLYLDAELFLRHLPGATAPGGRALLGAVRQRLRGSPTLVPSTGEPRPKSVTELLAEALVEGLEPSERAAPRTVLAWLDAWLSGDAGASVKAPGEVLASHAGARRLLCRMALRRLRKDNTFHDTRTPGGLDLGVIAEHLEPADEPAVAISGHTHAAREITLPRDRHYLNTGTWTDQIVPPRPEDPAELRRWIDDLESGRVERRRRLTYAHVTRDSARLRIWRDR